MELRDQINEFIEKHKFEIVSRTCDFIKIPSISTSLGVTPPDDSDTPYGRECARALDFCDDLCKELGLVTKNYDYRCLEATCKEEQTGKRLLIVTHADVVPGSPEGNIYEPFAGKVYGEYIVGRGAVDDKGPLISSLYALAFFKEYNIPLKNDIRLLFGSNEECGLYDDMEYYLEKAGEPDWALAADGDFPTSNGERSRLSFRITAAKSDAVSFIRSYGTKIQLIQERCESTINNKNFTVGATSEIVNPIAHTILNAEAPVFKDAAVEACIRELLQDPNGTCMGIANEHEISGGSLFRAYHAETNGDEIALDFDVREPYSVDMDEVIAKIQDYCAKHGLGFRVNKLTRGFYQAPDQEVVAALTDMYNKETGMHEVPWFEGACTYARSFKNSCGFGNGYRYEEKPFPKGHGACHGPDEAHRIGTLLDAVKYFVLGIKTIDDMWS